MIATQSSEYTLKERKGKDGKQLTVNVWAWSETIGRMQCNLPADHTFNVLSQEPLQN